MKFKIRVSGATSVSSTTLLNGFLQYMFNFNVCARVPRKEYKALLIRIQLLDVNLEFYI